MKRLLKTYLPVAILTIIIGLPFLFPMRFLWPHISSTLLRSPSPDHIMLGQSAFEIGLRRIEGVFWRGSVDISLNKLPVGKVHWEIQPATLLEGQLGAYLTIDGPFHAFSGLLSSNGTYLQITQFNGKIEADAITPFSSTYGLYPEGVLSVENLQIELQKRWLSHLSGQLSWGGGAVQYRTMDARADYHLPPLTAFLSLAESDMVVEVFTTESQSVIEASLKSSGWGKLNIRRRFFDLSGKTWFDTTAPDDIALTLEQKLW